LGGCVEDMDKKDLYSIHVIDEMKDNTVKGLMMRFKDPMCREPVGKMRKWRTMTGCMDGMAIEVNGREKPQHPFGLTNRMYTVPNCRSDFVQESQTCDLCFEDDHQSSHFVLCDRTAGVYTMLQYGAMGCQGSATEIQGLDLEAMYMCHKDGKHGSAWAFGGDKRSWRNAV
jgi:hypothetical protein